MDDGDTGSRAMAPAGGRSDEGLCPDHGDPTGPRRGDQRRPHASPTASSTSGPTGWPRCWRQDSTSTAPTPSTGLGEGDRLAVMLPNSVEFFDCMAATAKLATSALNLNWHLRADEVAWILDDSGAGALVTHVDLRDQVAAVVRDRAPPGPVGGRRLRRPPGRRLGRSPPLPLAHRLAGDLHLGHLGSAQGRGPRRGGRPRDDGDDPGRAGRRCGATARRRAPGRRSALPRRALGIRQPDHCTWVARWWSWTAGTPGRSCATSSGTG